MSSPLTLFQIPPETRERVRKAIRQLDAGGAPLTVRAVSRPLRRASRLRASCCVFSDRAT